ncbi:hypothetical protein CAAN1_05S04016 [[Candida] anglica]|uniref:Uncharacterized protein n=1 Tax=[Candida] anglica TaxID=148631 RepID=A0ABP0ECZ4_9ASCO
MSFIGVDVGTGSVRSCLITSNGESYTATKNISRVSNSKYSNFITQSTDEIFLSVILTIKQVIELSPKNEQVKGISVTATCSMAVFEVDQSSKENRLIPYACDYDGLDSSQNIILWMDSRALKECNEINGIVSKSILSSVGGSYIPEMGLPKLKWLSQNNPQEKFIVAFELHDWITAKLLSGDLCLQSISISKNISNNIRNGTIDGSILGCDLETLQALKITENNIFIGSANKQPINEFLGTNLGFISKDLYETFPLGVTSETIIVSGCIDCYAGWISTIMDPVQFSNPIYMVAGTSTCFLLPAISETIDKTNLVKGVWGPFSQFLPDISLYQSGQPATGKLYETLFNEYEELLLKEDGSPFEVLERETLKLERDHNQSITYLLRNYLYYGDHFGNRCPYNDPLMGSMMIDGFNSTSGLPSVWERSLVGLTIKYNLIQEFICLQTQEIITNMSKSNCLIDTIIISGSQSKNERFLKLLGKVTNKKIFIGDKDGESDTVVAKGAALLAKLGSIGGVLTVSTVSKYKQKFVNKSIDEEVPEYYQQYPSNSIQNSSDSSILKLKGEFLKEMAHLQNRFRSKINSCI